MVDAFYDKNDDPTKDRIYALNILTLDVFDNNFTSVGTPVDLKVD
jgi:hypothetical protein